MKFAMDIVWILGKKAKVHSTPEYRPAEFAESTTGSESRPIDEIRSENHWDSVYEICISIKTLVIITLWIFLNIFHYITSGLFLNYNVDNIMRTSVHFKIDFESNLH